MSLSKINTEIKNKINPNDVFITPLELAKTNINYVINSKTYKEDMVWLDPFRNTGNYFNQFPNENNEWCEILDNKDFFTYNGDVDIICSNPPYSCIDNVFKKSVELKPKIISYLIGVNNLTAKRIEYMENNGYIITTIHMCKVWKWFGMSFIIVFELKNKKNKAVINYDRIIWRN